TKKQQSDSAPKQTPGTTNSATLIQNMKHLHRATERKGAKGIVVGLRLGRRRSLSESPPSSNSEDSRRKRRKRVSSSSSDSSDNEDEETRHWKSRNGYQDKRRRMPASVKTYDGTGDPDDHLKIFESAATIENWPQPPVRGDRGNDKYTPLTKTPKEILATKGANFPKPPPMRTPEERRVGNGQKGHTTNECIQLRQLINKLVKKGRLDHLVKNIKEGKDKQKSEGKKDTPKDKADTIYMVQSWQRKTRQKVSQKLSRGSEISFPTLTADNTVVEPLTVEINTRGHDIHRMYIDGGASADILYEHCFQRLRPEVKSQLNPATTSLTGFTGEKIWPIGQIQLLVIVGNEEHSTRTWITFMVIRSPFPYNGIIGRPGISAIRAVPSTVTGCLNSL
nr:reverse transcriptase domain-containing protein [Tanacetum cinerariifolium]